MAKDKEYYLFIDGFRGIAVFWVILHHIWTFFPFRYFGGMWDLVFNPVASAGYLGVDIFFVISGFLITGLLLPDLDTQIRVKRFYARRFFKIVPQYLLLLGGAFLVLFLSRHQPVPAGFLSIPDGKENGAWGWYFFFLQNLPTVFSRFPILAHTWSLAIEEHFYLVYPLLLGGICCLHPDPQRRRRYAIGALIALIILGNLIRYVVASYYWPVVQGKAELFFQSTFFRVDALMFGCLLKFVEPLLDAVSPSEKRFMSRGFLWGGIGIFAFFVCYGFPDNNWWNYTLAYLAAGMLLTSCLAGASFLRKIAQARWLCWVGRSSYGIYLWHYILFFVLAFVWRDLPANEVTAVMGALVYLILAVMAGVLTTFTVERYFLNLRKSIVP